MRRFLTIDWDYLINASAKFRDLHFPDCPNESYSNDLKRQLWEHKYSCDSKLKEVGIKQKEYDFLLEFVHKIINENKDINILVSDSHKFMYSFVNSHMGNNEEFEVINFDFHHDMYDYRTSDEEVNCGNWCSELYKDFPKMHYKWVGQEDSNLGLLGCTHISDIYPRTTVVLDNTYLIAKTLNEGKEYYQSFNGIHICKSSMWSPPHLDSKFNEFIESVAKEVPSIAVKEDVIGGILL